MTKKRKTYIIQYNIKNKKYIDKYKKDWYQKNKEKILLKRKEYRKLNKEKIRLINQKYNRANKEKRKIYDMIKYQKNKEKILLKRKEYRKLNKEKIRLLKKKYQQKNKNKINNYHNNYMKTRKKIDIDFKLKCNLRTRIYFALKKNIKSIHTMELLGCTIDQLKEHLQSKFVNGMTWNNYGKWHVDHIRPCASFDMSDTKQQRECFHYSNLQPLWAEDNIKKRDKIKN